MSRVSLRSPGTTLEYSEAANLFRQGLRQPQPRRAGLAHRILGAQEGLDLGARRRAFGLEAELGEQAGDRYDGPAHTVV